jgi:hypothetical protein
MANAKRNGASVTSEIVNNVEKDFLTSLCEIGATRRGNDEDIEARPLSYYHRDDSDGASD